MKIFVSLLLVAFLCNSCSYVMPPRKVECCEKKAACCHGQMCCLPRYAKAAGVEPRAFTPEVPVYSSAQDVEPAPGEMVEKPTWFSRLNPFKGSGSSESSSPPPPSPSASAEESPDDNFWGNLWPF